MRGLLLHKEIVASSCKDSGDRLFPLACKSGGDNEMVQYAHRVERCAGNAVAVVNVEVEVEVVMDVEVKVV